MSLSQLSTVWPSAGNFCCVFFPAAKITIIYTLHTKQVAYCLNCETIEIQFEREISRWNELGQVELFHATKTLSASSESQLLRPLHIEWINSLKSFLRIFSLRAQYTKNLFFFASNVYFVPKKRKKDEGVYGIKLISTKRNNEHLIELMEHDHSRRNRIEQEKGPELRRTGGMISIIMLNEAPERRLKSLDKVNICDFEDAWSRLDEFD